MPGDEKFPIIGDWADGDRGVDSREGGASTGYGPSGPEGANEDIEYSTDAQKEKAEILPTLREVARHGDYWITNGRLEAGWYASWHPDEVYYRTAQGIWMTSFFQKGDPVHPVHKLGPIYDQHPQSNLVDHARRELELLGEEHMTIDAALRVVQAFADMGHSGASAAWFTDVLTRLLKFQNISDLTDDPDEWNDVTGYGASMNDAEPMWQSRRRSDAFSNDGGKTYYCLDDDLVDDGEGNATRIMHGSKPHTKEE